MTKKRFVDNGIEEIENQSFTDNLTKETYWIDHGLDEIVDLLNAFNDENEQLKQENSVFEGKDAKHYQRWVNQIKKYVEEDNPDFTYDEDFIIKIALSYTLQSLRNGESLKRFQWDYKELLEKENLDLSEELDYYKAKCASLETGLFQADKENKQLKMENNSLKLLVQNWEALDEEKDEQLDRQNQALKKLVKENAQLKQLINDKEVEWLRNNTIWEQMPTSKRTITKTTFGDEND